MSLTFHWFLPTSGDGRSIVGRGHSVPAPPEPPPDVYFGGSSPDRIEEYASLGISEFILSGYPHLEEACWFGEGVRP